LFRSKNLLQVSSDPQMVENGFAPAGTPSVWNLIANEMIFIDCSHLVLGM
jgi:hypothetical protein